MRIVEAADAGHGAEVMIERAVFLHQQDDVLDLLQRRRRRLRLHGSNVRRTTDGKNEAVNAAAASRAPSTKIRRRVKFADSSTTAVCSSTCASAACVSLRSSMESPLPFEFELTSIRSTASTATRVIF